MSEIKFSAKLFKVLFVKHDRVKNKACSCRGTVWLRTVKVAQLQPLNRLNFETGSVSVLISLTSLRIPSEQYVT